MYLACACAAGNPAAIEVFEKHYLAQVPLFVSRVDRSPEFADELMQFLRTELLVGKPGRQPYISEYSGRGALGGWLRIVAVRQAHGLRNRKGDRTVSDEAAAAKLVAVDPDPELRLLKARHSRELADALKHAISALPARERNLLKLHVVDELTIDDLCRLYNVHRATVARWIVRCKQELLQTVTRALKEQLAIDSADVASLCRAVQSQLDLSLSGLIDGAE
jgi:RNA polymerase sigma-70 factor (ECF subfamily)